MWFRAVLVVERCKHAYPDWNQEGVGEDWVMENPQDGDGYSDLRDRQREQYRKQSNPAHNGQILPLVVKTMSNSKHETALQAVEEALALLRSAPVLEGTAKESVEILLEVAVENLRGM